jgi:hypothetical protein
MRFNDQLALTAAGANLVIGIFFSLTGCGGGNFASPPVATPLAIAGNWQVSSTAAAAGVLPVLSGALDGTTSAVTGTFHPASANACVAPTTAIDVTGSADTKNFLTLKGNVAGGTLTVTGLVAADGKSLNDAAYTITGGRCAQKLHSATAVSFSSVTGTYVGTLSDATGPVISVTANLVQTPDADTSGNFQISGTGSFANNECFNSPVTVASSQVTGGNLTLTYTDPVTRNSVTVSGTFSPDASTLAITSWKLSGSTCLADSGTGRFLRQS